MLFSDGPCEIPGLKIVLRAKPALLDDSTGGKKLAYEFNLSGKAPIPDGKRSDPTCATLEAVDASVVSQARKENKNPIFEIFDKQKELLAEFFTDDSSMLAAMS